VIFDTVVQCYQIMLSECWLFRSNSHIETICWWHGALANIMLCGVWFTGFINSSVNSDNYIHAANDPMRCCLSLEFFQQFCFKHLGQSYIVFMCTLMSPKESLESNFTNNKWKHIFTDLIWSIQINVVSFWLLICQCVWSTLHLTYVWYNFTEFPMPSMRLLNVMLERVCWCFHLDMVNLGLCWPIGSTNWGNFIGQLCISVVPHCKHTNLSNT